MCGNNCLHECISVLAVGAHVPARDSGRSVAELPHVLSCTQCVASFVSLHRHDVAGPFLCGHRPAGVTFGGTGCLLRLGHLLSDHSA
jgi:hypothetical protein